MSIFDASDTPYTPDNPPSSSSSSRSSSDHTELVKLLGSKLISRKDVKAIEGSDGSWRPATDTGRRDGKRLPFTMKDFTQHLEGKVTLGHYLLGKDSTCKFFLFDIDFDKEGYYLDLSSNDDGIADKVLSGAVECNPREVWQDPSHPGYAFLEREIKSLTEGLARLINRTLTIPVAVLNSGGKGFHVYGLCGERDAEVVRNLALGALNHLDTFTPTHGDNFFKHKHTYENITIEVFPKQGSLDGKDLGNLVRLPLGINRKTGNRSFFVATKTEGKWTEKNPLQALDGDAPWE